MRARMVPYCRPWGARRTVPFHVLAQQGKEMDEALDGESGHLARQQLGHFGLVNT